MLQAVASGAISLDDRPQKYFPFWTNSSSDPRSQITLEKLLSMTSGYKDDTVYVREENPSVPCVVNASYDSFECVKQIYDTVPLWAEPGKHSMTT